MPAARPRPPATPSRHRREGVGEAVWTRASPAVGGSLAIVAPQTSRRKDAARCPMGVRTCRRHARRGATQPRTPSGLRGRGVRTTRPWGCVPHCGAGPTPCTMAACAGGTPTSVSPWPIDELLFKTAARAHRPEPALADGRRDDQRRRLRARLVRDRRRSARPLSQHHAGLERRQPARPRRAHRVAAVPRAHPRHDRDAGAADQLPPVPPRALAVRPQRRDRRLPGDAPRTAAGGGARAVRRHRGVDGLRGALLSRADLRARGRPAGRDGTGGRVRRGDRPRARRRAPDADDASGSATASGCGPSATRPSTSRARCSSPSTPTRCGSCTREPAPAAVHRRGSDRRLRAARRPARSVARDPRVDGADHPARPRRTTAVQPTLE